MLSCRFLGLLLAMALLPQAARGSCVGALETAPAGMAQSHDRNHPLKDFLPNLMFAHLYLGIEVLENPALHPDVILSDHTARILIPSPERMNELSLKLLPANFKPRLKFKSVLGSGDFDDFQRLRHLAQGEIILSPEDWEWLRHDLAFHVIGLLALSQLDEWPQFQAHLQRLLQTPDALPMLRRVYLFLEGRMDYSIVGRGPWAKGFHRVGLATARLPRPLSSEHLKLLKGSREWFMNHPDRNSLPELTRETILEFRELIKAMALAGTGS